MLRYLGHFCLSAILIASAMLAFNWYVDPYAIFRTPDAEHINSNAKQLVLNERVFKTVRLARQKTDIALIGSSRTDLGFDSNHEIFAGKTVSNLATFRQFFYESYRLMQLAVEQAKPQSIIVGLDFFAFNEWLKIPSDFTEENFQTIRPFQLAFSISTTMDAKKVLRNNRTVGSGDCCHLNGFRVAKDPSILVGTYMAHFKWSENEFTREIYLPYPECSFSYASKKDGDDSTLTKFRTMVRLAYQQNIDLHLFISPAHARQWEVLGASGLWDKWEEWKRLLVKINEDEAQKAGHAAFSLWDFSGYNTITNEAVPADGDLKTKMFGYTDSSHYTPKVGNLVLDRMFDLHSDGRSMPDDFGVLLKTGNIERHFENIRAAREHYRKAHSADVAEIEASASAMAKKKHCNHIIPTVLLGS
jgi:hypothetical protein